MRKLRSIHYLLPAVVLLTNCSKTEITKNSEDTAFQAISETVEASSNGGNVSCEEAALLHGLTGYDYSTGKQDYPFTSSSFGSDVSVITDGTYVSWSIDPPDGFCVTNVAVIVKGGNEANVYYYDNGEIGDTGLTSPVNASGNPAELSNLTICYNLEECESNSCDWQEETAFAGDIPGQGSAWWFALDASNSGSYPIYAGQAAVPGASITYDASSDLLSINLGSNLQLQGVNEPVKVEGFDVLPVTRPPAGLFQLYKGNDLVIQGNGSNYYVIHLDVEVCN